MATPDVRRRWTVIASGKPSGAPALTEVKRPAPSSVEGLPRWARAADVVSIVLVIAGLTVSVTGGFRLRMGEWRLALTTMSRPLLMALLIAGVRHALVPKPPIHAHVLAQGREWVRSVSLRTAASVLAGSRPAILLVGLLAVLTFGYPPGAPPWRDYDNELMNLPLRWDAGWYLQIAETGYSYSPEAGAGAQQNIVFFPGYPMVTRAIALLLGNQKTAYVVAGTIVSLASFLFALAYLFAFAREAIGEERAHASLWLIAAYPFAVFFGAIYSESLYLLAALGAFHHFQRHQFTRAGLWGLVAGLTRPNGGLLTIPLVLLALSDRRSRFRVEALVAAAAMPAIGTLLYSMFVWEMTGNPLAWASGHAAWGRHYTSVPQLVTTRASFIGHAGLYEYVAWSPYDLLNVLGALFVIAAIWPVWRRFGIAFAAFIVVNILPPLTTGGFLSAGRISSVLFPAFVWLGAAVPVRHRTAWIVSFATLQALCAALFYTWRPLF
jgi:hypothetical protein